MTPYPHPQGNLDIFRYRLAADIAVDASTFAITCGAPVPTASLVENDAACQGQQGRYNTLVDVGATGALTGEVQGFLYNRLDLAQLPLSVDGHAPFLKGTAATVVDLLDAINDRWGTSFLPEDVQATPIPVCDCACGPMAVAFVINPLSLIYLGSLTVYVVDDVALPQALLQPFLPTPVVPPPTPTP